MSVLIKALLMRKTLSFFFLLRLDSREKCSNDEYPCQSSQLCIPQSNQCDTISQCHDRTDEMFCSCPLDDYQREKYFLFCSRTDQCLPKDSPCPQKFLCQSDSLFFIDDSCGLSCSIDGKCREELCPTGFRTNLTTGHCDDINECDETVRCDHFCFNTNGSYQCACEFGYQLKSDKHTCVLRSTENNFVSMFGLTNDGIYRWKMIDPFVNEKSLIMSINDTYLMDYDPVENFVYLVQCAQPLRSSLRLCSKSKGIYRFHWPNHRDDDNEVFSLKLIVDGDVYPSISSMSIDWLHGNIYFVNIDFHTIHICRLDGRFCRIFFQPSIVDYHPLHLVVDPEKGFVEFLRFVRKDFALFF